MNDRYYVKCSYCGRFCEWDSDSGTYYGGTFDMEPLEPEHICKRCVAKELKTPERVIVGCWWIKPTFVRVAKSILRHRRKHEN
jgi:hypothetical protein